MVLFLVGVCPQPEVASRLLDITMHQLSIKNPTLSHPQSMRDAKAHLSTDYLVFAVGFVLTQQFSS